MNPLINPSCDRTGVRDPKCIYKLKAVSMGNLGFSESVIFLVIALLVFGPGKMPEIGKSLGKGIAEFKNAFAEGEAASEAGSLQASPTHPSKDEKPPEPSTWAR